MNFIQRVLWTFIVIFGLISCSDETVPIAEITATQPRTTPTRQTEIPTSTSPPQTATVVPSQSISLVTDTDTFPLSEYGLYEFGTRLVSFDDSNRDNRHISITVWYPAVRPEQSTSSDASKDVPADLSGAPYPVILTSTKSGRIFGPHLVSHGFVVVGVNGMKPSNWWGEWLIDYPLDLVFALDMVAEYTYLGLEGMFDTSQAGAMGYSFGGYNALALSGARVDPEFYLSQCAEATTMQPPPATWWVRYICEMADDWDAFAAHAGDRITTSEDGLWQPISDERIRAVIPMAPEGAWLFGTRGLAAVDRPTMIIGATLDDLNYYDLEAVYLYEHFGTPDRVMVSFVGEDHMMIYQEEQVAKMKHFAAAFFGYYLQNRGEYADYFSEEFVAQFQDLAWGVYPQE